MRTALSIFVLAALLLVPAERATAQFLDLSSWSELTLDLTGGQSAGNWVLSNSNQTVTQTVNADPSFYHNNTSLSNYQMDGSWRVITGADDDFMGFVFGFQDASHFYLMDWKQNTQDAGPDYGLAQEGFTIRKISAPSVASLTLRDFWNSTGATNSTILATNYGSTLGWQDNVLYDFHLEFNSGLFSLEVKQGATSLWSQTVNDNSYTSGEFGFYNFSQQQVEYSGFQQRIIPEPSTVLLFACGLAGFAWSRRRKS